MIKALIEFEGENEKMEMKREKIRDKALCAKKKEEKEEEKICIEKVWETAKIVVTNTAQYVLRVSK